MPTGGSSTPDFDVWFGGDESWQNLSWTTIVAGASNIIVGTNPAYAVADFLSLYPQFGVLDSQGNYTSGPLPLGGALAILNSYIALASACLQQPRWLDLWTTAMGLFVAHQTTLFLQSFGAGAGSTAAQVVSAAVAKGITVSKSVGPLSKSIKDLVSGWEEWGAFNLTLFGQQLITFAKMVGFGVMWVY